MTGQAAFDEADSLQSIADIRIDAGSTVEFLSDCSENHIVECGLIDVGKRFEKALGMPPRNSRRRSSQLCEVIKVGIPPVDLNRLAQAPND